MAIASAVLQHRSTTININITSNYQMCGNLGDGVVGVFQCDLRT